MDCELRLRGSWIVDVVVLDRGSWILLCWIVDRVALDVFMVLLWV